jgi:hypothetical protein
MKTTQLGHRSRHSFGTAARFGAVLGSATFLLFNAPAWAQEPTAADTAAARDLAIEGMKLADSERCGQAIDKLDRAEKLRHSPIVLGRLGECRIQVGKFVEGIEDLQRLLHESPPPNPPANLSKARERAQAALDAAKPNLAYLAISVSGPNENVTVTIDGQPVSSLLLDRERPTDPGEHVVEATAAGYNKATRRLAISAGERQEVALKLTPDPQAQAAAPVNATNATASKPADEVIGAKPAVTTPRPVATAQQDKAVEPGSSGGRTLSYVLMGAGTAIVATGGVFGYLALNDKHNLDGQCPNNSCAPSSKGTLDAANRKATVATVLGGSGAGVLALGAIIYFASGSSEKERPPTASVDAHAYVGLGQAGVVGSF